MILAADLREAVVNHAGWCAPEEACGLLAVDREGTVRFFYPISNVDGSTESFTLDQREMLRAADHAEAMGWELGGVMHSHPHGPARLSARDVLLSPASGWLHVVVSGEQIGLFRVIEGFPVPVPSSRDAAPR